MRSIEIVCTACGADTFVKREPRYEGFKKTGERFCCASCGHEFASEEEVPYKEKATVSVFDESDRPEQIDVFTEDEKERNCRHCVHYVLNPFVQRCGLHNKFIEATDLCDDFEKKVKEDDGEEETCDQ